MSYAMFIDDERVPLDVTWMSTDFAYNNWVICRNLNEVLYTIAARGMPDLISFDHDLGNNEPTGFDITKKLVDMDLDGDIKFPDKFDFEVHSKNPVGAENIKSYLNNYLRMKA
jgi:hypothetical protein